VESEYEVLVISFLSIVITPMFNITRKLRKQAKLRHVNFILSCSSGEVVTAEAMLSEALTAVSAASRGGEKDMKRKHAGDGDIVSKKKKRSRTSVRSTDHLRRGLEL
jgi:hypothetical protein